MTLPSASLEPAAGKSSGLLLPRRAAVLEFDTVLAGSLGTGLPFADAAALRLSGLPLPVSGEALPLEVRAAAVGADGLVAQGSSTASLLTAPVPPAPATDAADRLASFGDALPQPSTDELPRATRTPLTTLPDPRPLAALASPRMPVTEPPPPPTTTPVAGMTAAAPLPPTAIAVPARAGAVVGAVVDAGGARRQDSTAPGSGPAAQAILLRPAATEVPALAAAEQQEADPQSGADRQAPDTGAPAGQALLRPERALSLDAPAAATGPDRDSLKEPVGTARWQHELGQRLVHLTGQGAREVRLQLHPEHLGPLEVRITLHDSQVGLWFGAQHAETREALEQSLPRLREMFAQGGLTMADASFAQHHQDRGSQATAAREPDWNAAAASNATQSVSPAPRAAAGATAGLIDEYA